MAMPEARSDAVQDLQEDPGDACSCPCCTRRRQTAEALEQARRVVWPHSIAGWIEPEIECDEFGPITTVTVRFPRPLKLPNPSF